MAFGAMGRPDMGLFFGGGELEDQFLAQEKYAEVSLSQSRRGLLDIWTPNVT